MIRISEVDYMSFSCVKVQQVYTKCVYFSILIDQFTCINRHLFAVTKIESYNYSQQSCAYISSYFILHAFITQETNIHGNLFYHSYWWIKISEKYIEVYTKESMFPGSSYHSHSFEYGLKIIVYTS